MEEGGPAVCGAQPVELAQEADVESLGLANTNVPHVHVVTYGQHQLWGGGEGREGGEGGGEGGKGGSEKGGLGVAVYTHLQEFLEVFASLQLN